MTTNFASYKHVGKKKKIEIMLLIFNYLFINNLKIYC